jgi:uncharacterized protein YbcV (DUF1398 family)
VLYKKRLFLLIASTILFSFVKIYGDINREMGLLFLPYETKNLITLNFKRIFKLYDKNDIYKFTFFNNRDIKKILDLFFGIIKDGNINLKKELFFMTMSSTDRFNPIQENYLDSIVIIVRALHKKKIIEKSIKKNIKKLFPRVVFNVRNKRKGKIINVKIKKKSFSIYLANERTIIIGNNKNIIKYEEVFSKSKKNILKNMHFNKSLKIIRNLPILGFHLEFSDFFKNLLRQDDKSFKLHLKSIKNIYGKINSDKITWSIDLKVTSYNKKGNLITVQGIRKLLAMSAMGGEKYIKYTQKIDVNEIRNGIRIFFNFEVE